MKKKNFSFFEQLIDDTVDWAPGGLVQTSSVEVMAVLADVTMFRMWRN